MKTILAFLFLSLTSAICTGQTTSTINIAAKLGTIGSNATVHVFLNDELAGSVGELENLQCKVTSKGRMIITITYPEAYIRKSTNLDVEKGKTYYVFITSSYTAWIGKEEDFNALEPSIKKTLKYEEDRHSPIVKGVSNEDEPGQGTCFLISKKGYLLTNYHVVKNAKTLTVKGVGGDFSTTYGVDVIGVDVDNDFALLKFKNQNILLEEPPYSLSKVSTEQGAKAFVLGYPLANSMGEEIKLTDGLISAKSGYKGSLSQYQFSAPIQGGNSGSPVFNDNGDVIGIATAHLEGAENASYAMKSQYIYTFLGLNDNFTYTAGVNQLKALSMNDKLTKLKKFIYIIKKEVE